MITQETFEKLRFC